MDSVWNKTLKILKEKVTDQTYNNWFAPIKEASLSETTITLSVPNDFFLNWIRDNYIEMIKSSILMASNKEFIVEFALDDISIPSLAEQDNPDQKKTESFSWLKNMFTTPTKTMPESSYQKIGLNKSYTFDDFVVGPGNRFAHAAALAISENPAKTYNPFFLYGGVGLGKTHLLQAIGHYVMEHHPKKKMLFISSEEFTNQLIQSIRTRSTEQFRLMYRNIDVLLIDDIQFIAGKDATQEEFFHTFNKLYDSHKQIILTSDRPPKEIASLEERLITRFSWGLVADVQAPDFETRMAILAKKSEHAEVPVPQEVLSFLAEKIKTNIRELEGALIRVVAQSKLTGCPLSRAMTETILKGMITEEEKKITIPLIQQVVSDYFGLSILELKSKKRTQSIAFPRQIAMYLSRTLTDASFPYIGEQFGGKDHTTVLHGCEKIKKEILSVEKTRKLVDLLLIKVNN
ncbi:MAG: chromosomal replication initiator protein DnaA [Candidatus Omnitrophica bacterium]|nr:chromosomal replication initiator protein DnaA [Candidatus Omnitrophota bacterium]